MSIILFLDSIPFSFSVKNYRPPYKVDSIYRISFERGKERGSLCVMNLKSMVKLTTFVFLSSILILSVGINFQREIVLF
jgi:hypothetical protein